MSAGCGQREVTTCQTHQHSAVLVQGHRAAGQMRHVVFGAIRHQRVANQAYEPPRPGVGEDTLCPRSVFVKSPGLEPSTLRRHLEAEMTCVAQRREVS